MPEISEEDLQSLNEAKTQLDTSNKSMEGLKGELDTLKVAKTDLERKLDDADKELLGEDYLDFKAGKKVKPSDDGSGGEVDLDRASNKEVVAHSVKQAKADLDAAIKSVDERFSKAEEAMGKSFAVIDVSLCAMRNPDFDANKDAIYAVSKQNPTWGAQKCYSQWKMESKKATDDKAAVDKKKAEDEKKALTEKDEGVPDSTTQGKQLSKEEAANTAYDKVFGSAEK